MGARKGAGSVAFGIQWLQDLEEIVIDPARCPESAREFTGYELERDRDGGFRPDSPTGTTTTSTPCATPARTIWRARRCIS
ncbi:MAG: hypothetical protein ACLSAF_07570 [Intestinimonas sp.]